MTKTTSTTREALVQAVKQARYAVFENPCGENQKKLEAAIDALVDFDAEQA